MEYWVTEEARRDKRTQEETRSRETSALELGPEVDIAGVATVLAQE